MMQITEIQLEVVKVPLPPEKEAAYYHALELIWDLVKDVPVEAAAGVGDNKSNEMQVLNG